MVFVPHKHYYALTHSSHLNACETFHAGIFCHLVLYVYYYKCNSIRLCTITMYKQQHKRCLLCLVYNVQSSWWCEEMCTEKLNNDFYFCFFSSFLLFFMTWTNPRNIYYECLFLCFHEKDNYCEKKKKHFLFPFFQRKLKTPPKSLTQTTALFISTVYSSI